ncbi:magnesium transporter [Candidatus Uhrbacteria bacterium]|nr:magnesium transporter [Candidatus Uhrbacteria bacterium]
MLRNHIRLVDEHLLNRVPIFSPTTKVREVVEHITDKRHDFESVNYIYLVDGKKLVGVCSVKELLKTPGDTPVLSIAQRKIITTHPHATLERAAILAIQHGIKAVPVQDREEIFLGVVGTDTILQTLHREHTEDLLRMGGVEIVEQKHILEMVTDRIGHLVRIRLPWLILGLLGGFVATFVVSRFEEVLSRTLALAFFMPLVVYMASAVGAQTQTIFIRASAIKKLSPAKYIGREIIVDIILGLALAAILGLYAIIFTRHTSLAFAVSIALFIAVVFAGVIAIFIPWLLMHLKKDPAIGAGPFGTVIQDILSLVVYFLVATALL